MASFDPLDQLRQICLALPEVTERLSHGEPTWFVRDKKTFVSYSDHHHDGGPLAFTCAAPEGVQQLLVTNEPQLFFRPPYVGHRGWIGAYRGRAGRARLLAMSGSSGKEPLAGEARPSVCE